SSISRGGVPRSSGTSPVRPARRHSSCCTAARSPRCSTGGGSAHPPAAGTAGGPTLLLLHGVTLTAVLNWSGILQTLGRRYRILLLDQRGHGEATSSGAFRLEDCADDAAAVAGKLGVERLVVVGYSMGGLV